MAANLRKNSERISVLREIVLEKKEIMFTRSGRFVICRFFPLQYISFPLLNTYNDIVETISL